MSGQADSPEHDQQAAAGRKARQRTETQYQAEANQLRDEPFPASSHDQPGQAGAEQDEQDSGVDGAGGAVHELDDEPPSSSGQ